MSGSSPGGVSNGGDTSTSFDLSANLSDITADKSLLIEFADRANLTGANMSGRNGSDTIITITDESSLLIDAEAAAAAYGKRKRRPDESDDDVLSGHGAAANESANSLELSDRDTSTKDESDFSGDNLDDSGPISAQPLQTDDEFPSTVTVLQTRDGAMVYLVGTAHFSEESQEDVSKVIQKVRPHIVMVELCKQRINILKLDEQTILEEAKNIDIKKIKSIVQQNGIVNSLMYILILNMSAQITKQLGIAPGGEFRRALQEAKCIPGCIVQLGDRPIHVTMQRALSALSWWQVIKLIWRLLVTNDPISKEIVEQCKQRDLLDEMLADMENEFPTLKRVFVEERDLFLTHSLQIAASTKSKLKLEATSGPIRVVGVVGLGHIQGITKKWGTVPTKAIAPIMKIPPPSRSSRILKGTFRLAFVGLIIYAGYRVIPKHWLPC